MMGRVCHMAREEEESLAVVAVRGRPGGRRSVGWPRKRRYDCLEENVEGVTHEEDSIYSERSRERFRELMTAAKDLHDLQCLE